MPWWRQKAAEDQLRFMVEAIFSAVRLRRRQESGKCGDSEGGSEGESMDSK